MPGRTSLAAVVRDSGVKARRLASGWFGHFFGSGALGSAGGIDTARLRRYQLSLIIRQDPKCLGSMLKEG